MSMTSDETLAVTEASQVGQARRAAIRLAIASKLSHRSPGRGGRDRDGARQQPGPLRPGRPPVHSVDATAAKNRSSRCSPSIQDRVWRICSAACRMACRPEARRAPASERSGACPTTSTSIPLVGQGTLVLSRVSSRGPKQPQRALQLGGDLHAGAARDRVRRRLAHRRAERRPGRHGRRRARARSARGRGCQSGRGALRRRSGPSEPARFCESRAPGARRAAAERRWQSPASRRQDASGMPASATSPAPSSAAIAAAVCRARTARSASRCPAGAGIRLRVPERGVLVMHSDGLTSRWSLDAYQGLLSRHPALIAGVLYRDFSGDETMPRSSSSSESRSRQGHDERT